MQLETNGDMPSRLPCRTDCQCFCSASRRLHGPTSVSKCRSQASQSELISASTSRCCCDHCRGYIRTFCQLSPFAASRKYVLRTCVLNPASVHTLPCVLLQVSSSVHCNEYWCLIYNRLPAAGVHAAGGCVTAAGMEGSAPWPHPITGETDAQHVAS